MKLLDFPIVKVTFCYIIGILLGAFFSMSLLLALTIMAFTLLALIGLFFSVRNKFKQSVWFGVIAFFSIICLGNLSVKIHNDLNYPSHYTNIDNNNELGIANFELQIKAVLKPNKYNRRYIADIQRINSKNTFGNILLNVSKNPSFKQFSVDDKILLNAQLQELYKPLNPYQFNYKRYLENHQIYAQIYSEPEAMTVTPTKKQSIHGYANSFRQFLNKKINKYDFSSSEMAVINALFLGQRQTINKELQEDYVNAGAIHILAISGLHIGIILLILKYLLTPFSFAKYGSYIKMGIIIFLLWSYAVVAGLSPSILRAVTMFSIITVGMYLKRPYNIYNTLAISAMILLVFNPLIIFEIGFQLSYLAVIGIVAIHPLLYKRLKTSYWFPNKIIELASVSIAAQLGIFPLSLFYFHQFPGLFLLTNVVIIPLLGIILSYGFIVFLLASLNVPSNFFIAAFGDIISLMNLFFKWVASQEAFLFKNLAMTGLIAIALYLIIVATTQIAIKKTYSRLLFLLLAIGIFQLSFFGTKLYHARQNELVVLHKSKHSILLKKQDAKISVYHNLDSLKYQSDYLIANYEMGRFIKQRDTFSMGNVYRFNNEFLLVVDSVPIYKNIGFKPDYVMLRNSPRINLTRLLNTLNPKLIIADGSNYKSYVKRWQETCKKRKRPFHYTGEKGAFVLKAN